MKKTIAALAVSLAATLPALAQPKADDHAAHHAPAAADMSEGEVRKVDKGAGKITLKHGEIKSLDMPPMTMVFGVKDPALLDQVKPGDKVLFKAVNEAGKFTISNLQVVK
jgi:Cu(I)/Ag(I) efflux system protein CusF